MALSVSMDVLLGGQLASLKAGMQKRASINRKTLITKRAKALARGGEVTVTLKRAAEWQLKREGKI